MKYNGYFKSLNETPYKVVIDTGGSGETEIILGSDPFIAKWEGSETIYKPLKLSGATTSVVTNNYLFDIYNPTAKGTKIQLFSNETNLEWSGYVEPNIYNQDFNQELETIEINAIDALSTLEYFKYESDKKSIISFLDIIKAALSKVSGDYTTIYETKSNNLSLSQIYISESNFFDEDNNPMTYKEVIEEIMKYLGYTMIAHKNCIYIIDYDAIKTGINTYNIYQSSDNFANFNTTTGTLSNFKDITDSDVTETGASLSLDEVFNKVKVECSLYSFNSLLPDIGDNLTNYAGNWNATEKNQFSHTTTDGSYYKNHFYRYYLNSKYKSYYYNKSNWAEVELPAYVLPTGRTDGDILYNFMKENIGATILKYVSYKTDEIVPSLEFENYLVIHRHLGLPPSDGITKKVFELKTDTLPEASFSGKYYLVISGEGLWDDRLNALYLDSDYQPKDDSFVENNLRLICKLKVGNKFWNGSSWSVYDQGGFWIPFKNSEGNTDHFINKWFPIKNTVSYTDEIDGNGYAIPINESDNLYGNVEFTIYSPSFVNTSKKVTALWLKNLKLEIYSPNPEREIDTDTVYENIINEDYVKEGETVGLKICTYTGKSWSYSSPFLSNGNYILTLTNSALNVTQTPEKTIIQRLVNQYSTPSKILEISLKNDIFPYSKLTNAIFNNVFIVDSMEVDYFINKSTLKLVEKK